MKRVLLFIISMAFAIGISAQPARLAKNSYGATQLVVKGKPFLMLAGELHNSSASTVEHLSTVWPKVATLGLNTVLAAVAWEQIEPMEDKFDFTLVDSLISGARRNNLHLGILWFGSWKNGESSYAPLWVKHNTKRFLRVLNKEGKKIETLSSFCEANWQADAKAFARLMAHIRDVDSDFGTVIIVQPENEVGIFQDIDYQPAALKALKAGNFPKSNIVDDKAALMAYQYATYVNKVAEAGKKEYALPMYCNCWLVQNAEQEPGDYPNGGPVTRVHDIWKKAAPAIDMLCPDIYLDDFKSIVADYHYAADPANGRTFGNTLFIPEAMMKAENAFYAIGAEDALGYSPFGIEDGVGNEMFAQSYKVLAQIMPHITKYQGSDRIGAFFFSGDEKTTSLKIGRRIINIESEGGQSFGMVIQTGENEYLFAGMGFKATFTGEDGLYIEQVWEGTCDAEGRFLPYRLMNGDETYHNACLLAKGKQTFTSEKRGNYDAEHSDEIFVYSPETYKSVWSPAIYKVTVYKR